MNLKQFCWLYNETNRELNISNEELNELIKKYEMEEEEKRNKQKSKLFFEKKNEEEPEHWLNENEVFNLAIYNKGDEYQVEFILDDKHMVVAVNAGFGKLFLTEEEVEKLVDWSKKYLNIKSVIKKDKIENPLVCKTNNRYFICTSLIHKEHLFVECGNFEEFKEFVKGIITSDIQRELDFFELTLNIEKMWEKQKLRFRLSKAAKEPLFVSSMGITKDGTFLIRFKKDREGWVKYFEYN